MIIKKCNKCGAVLNKEDDYYTLDEISFHKGKSKYKKTLWINVQSDNSEQIYESEQSWCKYTDLDFCVDCFKAENLERFLK